MRINPNRTHLRIGLDYRRTGRCHHWQRDYFVDYFMYNFSEKDTEMK